MSGQAGRAGLRPASLIATARHLAQTDSRRPRHSNLRRATSTAYYAMFHCLAFCCADALVGTEGANRSQRAWRQAYRSLHHQHLKRQCDTIRDKGFPPGIVSFATTFAKLQIKRHKADYDPDWTPLKSSVLADIRSAETEINNLGSVDLKDRRAFAVWLVIFVRGG